MPACSSGPSRVSERARVRRRLPSLDVQILVTDAAWPQRKQFLEEVRRQLAAAPQRCAYYPGSDAKRAAFNARMTGHKVRADKLKWCLAHRWGVPGGCARRDERRPSQTGAVQHGARWGRALACVTHGAARLWWCLLS